MARLFCYVYQHSVGSVQQVPTRNTTIAPSLTPSVGNRLAATWVELSSPALVIITEKFSPLRYAQARHPLPRSHACGATGYGDEMRHTDSHTVQVEDRQEKLLTNNKPPIIRRRKKKHSHAYRAWTDGCGKKSLPSSPRRHIDSHPSRRWHRMLA